MVKVAFDELLPRTPLIVEVAVTGTGVVAILKVALVAPLGTETLPGTVAAEFEELSVTVTPFEPAFAEIVTLPVDEVPPDTDAGITVRALSDCPKLTAVKTAKKQTEKIKRLLCRLSDEPLIQFCKTTPRSLCSARKSQRRDHALGTCESVWLNHNTTHGPPAYTEVFLRFSCPETELLLAIGQESVLPNNR